jgi:hypothetical protein
LVGGVGLHMYLHHDIHYHKYCSNNKSNKYCCVQIKQKSSNQHNNYNSKLQTKEIRRLNDTSIEINSNNSTRNVSSSNSGSNSSDRKIDEEEQFIPLLVDLKEDPQEVIETL